MEVKVSDAVPEWLVNKLSELNIYKTSFSKYGKAYENFIKNQIEAQKQICISGSAILKENIIMAPVRSVL